MQSRILASALALLVGTSCATTFEPADIAPTPQRPKISKNTQTVAKDSVELEAGLHWNPNDFIDTPLLAKYGLTDNTELTVETAVLRSYEYPDPIGRETGIGDLGFGVRHRFENEGDTDRAYALEVVGKIPTSDRSDEAGKAGTGGRDPRVNVLQATTGSTDLTIAGIVEDKVEDFGVVGYGALNAYGSGYGGTLYQLLLASHATLPLTDADTAFVEISWAINESVSDTALIQGGVYRRIAGNMTADAAVGFGLNDDSSEFHFLLGLTTNFGYLR